MTRLLERPLDSSDEGMYPAGYEYFYAVQDTASCIGELACILRTNSGTKDDALETGANDPDVCLLRLENTTRDILNLGE